jgi:cytoskeletal protein CcmA (bactofilin family)
MENNTDTIIGVNVSLKGNLHNKGSIQVNGSVEGEVRSDENVLIGETAKVKGPVIAKKIEISGEVRGLIEASEKLEINSTGRIYGDINAKSLVIKEGAIFIGKSTMSSHVGTEEPAKAQVEEIKPASDEKDIKEEILKDKAGFFGKK